MSDSQWRADLTAKVAETIWAELERQHNSDNIDAPYVDRVMEDIDGSVNMTAIADAAIDTILAAFDPPF